MSADLDTGRLIRSWLRRTGPMSADRVLDNVLARLDTTPQRRSRWPARRIDALNNFARGIGVAAAVMLVAVLAISLSSNRGTGGPTATATGSPTFSHHPKSPAPSPEVRNPESDYTIGWHAKTVDGIRTSFDIPATGWEGFAGVHLSKSAFGPQDAEGILLWAAYPHGADADPCLSFHPKDPATPESITTAAELAHLAAIDPGVVVLAPPTNGTVGGRPAVSLVVTVRDTTQGCPPGYFYNWRAKGWGAFWYETRQGDTIRVWTVEVDGQLLFLEGITRASAPASLAQEIESIVDSIEFD